MPKPTPVPGLHPDLDRATGLRRILLFRLTDLLQYGGALCGGEDLPRKKRIEVVHDARVATRRLRAALGLCPFAPKRARARARDQVASLGRALGGVRDLDVLLSWLTRCQDEAGPGEKPGLQMLVKRTKDERATAEAALLEAARSFFGHDGGEGGAVAVGAAVLRLHGPSGQMGGAGLRQRLSDRLLRSRDHLGPALSGAALPLHALRIELKKLRYMAELLCEVVPGADTLAESLVPLQEALGEVHDLDARLHWLNERAGALDGHEEERNWPGLDWLLIRTYFDRGRRWGELQPVLRRFYQEDPLGRLATSLPGPPDAPYRAP